MTQGRDGTPDKARSEPATLRLQFSQKDSRLQIRKYNKRFFKSWQIAKSVISYSKFALVWVSRLFGIFFTFSLALCPAFQMDLPTVAMLRDSFRVTAHLNYTHHEWKAKGQPLETCPPVNISCLLLTISFGIVLLAEKTGR